MSQARTDGSRMEATAMPIAYREGTGHVYRASSIGYCTRALVAALLGHEEARYRAAGEIMDLAAGEGKLHEASIIEAVRGMGYEIRQEKRQQEFTVKVIPGAWVRGHIDGWATGGPEGVFDTGAVVEAKSMSHDRYKAWVEKGWDGGFRTYAWQLSAYMHAFATDRAVYAVKDRNTGRVTVKEIGGLPVPWKQIRRKVVEVEKWVERGELPPCDPEIESGERYFCPFAYLHDDGLFAGEGEDEGEALDDVTASVVRGLAERHWELTQVAQAGKAAEEERKQINEQLARHVMGKKVVTQDGIEVARVNGSRASYDMGAVALALGVTTEELKRRFERETKFVYFKTKRKED